MDLGAIEKKLAHLERRFYSRQVKSIDDSGQKVWMKGSSLEFMRTVLKAKRAFGWEVLPKALQVEARLWSRAEVPACGLSDMVRNCAEG